MSFRPLVMVGLLLTSMGAFAALEWTPAERAGAPILDLPPMGSLEPPEPEPLVRQQRYTIASGDTAGGLLRRFGARVDQVIAAAKPHYDLTKLRAGKVMDLTWHDPEPEPVRLAYGLDEDRTLVLERAGAEWIGRLDVVTYEAKPATREIVVKTSLWQAAVDAGLRPTDIAALAEVFEYDVDFNTEIQPGARARMAVDELWRDGAVAKLGPPHAVRFENGGKSYVAVRFQRPDGSWGYYDKDGMSRKKAFLRSPLAFSRVTSGFSLARYHPILKRSRPHLGVDYGAPKGTPVRAIGDGVVETASYSGGHGNFVKIDHEGPYASSYSHLSKISVKHGQKVRQGQVIGEVGSTGLATGPHLHFQFWVNDRYVNPQTLELPRTEPLPPAELATFQAERDRWLALIDGG